MIPQISSFDLDTIREARAPRVVFPWTRERVRWEALDALYKQYPGVLGVQLADDDPGAYTSLVLLLWELAETFVICEHDVIVPNSAVRRLLRCKHEWCTFPEPYDGSTPTDTFGLVKVEGSLIARWPDVGEYAAFPLGRHRPVKTWEAIAAEVAHRLRLHGVEPHVHAPELRHLHTFPSIVYSYVSLTIKDNLDGLTGHELLNLRELLMDEVDRRAAAAAEAGNTEGKDRLSDRLNFRDERMERIFRSIEERIMAMPSEQREKAQAALVRGVLTGSLFRPAEPPPPGEEESGADGEFDDGGPHRPPAPQAPDREDERHAREPRDGAEAAIVTWDFAEAEGIEL